MDNPRDHVGLRVFLMDRANGVEWRLCEVSEMRRALTML